MKTNPHEIIRWIYTNAAALLGILGNNGRPTENVYLTKRDYLIAVFIKELINHSPLIGSEKPCGFFDYYQAVVWRRGIRNTL